MDESPERVIIAVVGSAAQAAEVTLVLQAIGLSSWVTRSSDARHVVNVDIADRALAEAALSAYVQENPPRLPPAPPRPLAQGAARAAAAFIAAEFLIAVAASQSVLGAPWVERGMLNGPAVRAGQWWRPVTSLTLHADFAHLLGNLGFGALFIGLAARVYGSGLALLLTLAAAVTAGVIEAMGMPIGFESLGASTAVFAALGLLAPVHWPPRGRLQPWMTQAATYGGAVSLLGLLGVGDPRVDVTAHALGFTVGLAYGWPLRNIAVPDQVIQRLGAMVAALVLIAAWTAALGA